LRATNRVIGEEQRSVAERLLREPSSLHGICRAIGVSIRWLRDFMVACFEVWPEHLHLQPVGSPREVIRGCLEVEADELGSFVKAKTNKQWVWWIAMDKQTRHSIAFHGGDRSQDGATQLWANLPAVYREQATCSLDQHVAYTDVMPAAQHKAITKHARKTHHIERFHNTLRQRVSWLGRSTFFSKKLENHIGAIRYFICHSNLTRTALLV
jgi:insertion element IS1 protein InsB